MVVSNLIEVVAGGMIVGVSCASYPSHVGLRRFSCGVVKDGAVSSSRINDCSRRKDGGIGEEQSSVWETGEAKSQRRDFDDGRETRNGSRIGDRWSKFDEEKEKRNGSRIGNRWSANDEIEKRNGSRVGNRWHDLDEEREKRNGSGVGNGWSKFEEEKDKRSDIGIGNVRSNFDVEREKRNGSSIGNRWGRVDEERDKRNASRYGNRWSRFDEERDRRHGSRFGDEWGGFDDEKEKKAAVDDDDDVGRFKAAEESRGERFLSRALMRTAQKEKKSLMSATTVRKRKEVPQVMELNHNLPACYGCGALLQTSETEAPGYVPRQTYELKKKHHQLRSVLCGRCRLLSQGRMIPAVGGVGGYGSGKGYIPAEQLRAQLSHLRHQKALVVKLVDIVDFNGSFLGRVRDLIGANPIILVLTKVDLLPKGTNMAAVGDWLQESVIRKKLNVISIHLTSSKAQTGISRVAADISRQRLGRDVYVLGSANVGKSAFVTALLYDMGRRDPAATAALRLKPMQSAMPGTTLGPIEFQAFGGGGKLYDTPGVHLHHRMTAAVDPRDVHLLAFRRRLRGYIMGPPEPESDLELESLFEDIDIDGFLKEKSGGRNVPQENNFAQDFEEQSDEQDGRWTAGALVGHTLFWGGIARIDVVKAPTDMKFTFYAPSVIKVRIVPTEEADNFYKENVGKTLCPPSSNTMESWMGLEKVQNLSLSSEYARKRPAGDLVISGLGWITVGKADIAEEHSLNGSGNDEPAKRKEVLFEDEEIKLVVHTPKSVEIFVRPSMPLGRMATEWYEYSDLTDRELEGRPQIFY